MFDVSITSIIFNGYKLELLYEFAQPKGWENSPIHPSHKTSTVRYCTSKYCSGVSSDEIKTKTGEVVYRAILNQKKN